MVQGQGLEQALDEQLHMKNVILQEILVFALTGDPEGAKWQAQPDVT